jgi:hypothetical protein
MGLSQRRWKSSSQASSSVMRHFRSCASGGAGRLVSELAIQPFLYP